MKELSIHELDMVSGGVTVFGLSPTVSAMTINATNVLIYLCCWFFDSR